MLRNVRPLPINAPVLAVASLATAAYSPVGISDDRTTLYARGTSTAASGQTSYTRTLYQSTDDGATWTRAFSADNLIATGGSVIQSVTETDDGEILINIKDSASSPGRLFKSTGWATSHTTATFREVLVSVGGYFDNRWGLTAQTFGNDTLVPNTSKYGVVCEYGSQTVATFASGNAATNAARRVYWTENFGATWTQIFDLAAYFPNASVLHTHSAVYDPYWDRIWLTWGDTQTNTVGAGNMELLYSDDHGATWVAMPVQNNAGAAQSTTIVVLSDAIILGSDNAPGIVRIARDSYRKIGPITYPAIIATGTSAYLIATTGHVNRKQSGAPVLLAFTGASGRYYPALWYSPNGITWTEIWSNPSAAGGTLASCYGPTLNGYVAGDTTAGLLLRGQIEDPGANTFVSRLVITGDGTATVFTLAHGYDRTPTDVQGWDHRANAGSYTLTADATNITATFATAPANAVKVVLELRYS